MIEKKFVSGDEAVALAVRQAKPQVISAYPITPQTIVVERLSDYVEDGSLDAQYLYVESEHSAMSSCLGAAAMGARTFTATSSQGLMYMAECLPYASGSRYPIVMMDANRSIATPWSIYGDQRDTLSQLESGWIQLYVQDAQEAYDTIFQAYKLAEDTDVLLPVMVNLDGFVLTHTYELLQMISDADADAYIPHKPYINALDLKNPKASSITAGPLYNMEFRYQQHTATKNAAKKIKAINEEFSKKFGRSYGNGMVEAYQCDDADVVLITLGSVAGTARCTVDKMRAEGKKVGLLRIRCMVPFPAEDVAQYVGKAKAIGVLEKNLNFGYEGTVMSEVNSALKQAGITAPSAGYVGGLGGRSISKEDIEGIYTDLLGGKPVQDEINWINLRRDICGA